jgi:hypothetical protein
MRTFVWRTRIGVPWVGIDRAKDGRTEYIPIGTLETHIIIYKGDSYLYTYLGFFAMAIDTEDFH